ncbi:hypothetical protein AB1Y20_017799 [Prymnesium parvum]|uniref:FHA domain-containing protein n=1 Tax=Prymnesium parvum TaxID=97485 RepID=A0AB34JMS0_PRYPA|mmetsp:Transcript_25376/g.38204  ORF Transcript_25376/g.38204 Transcript_25376/m.38204 type:complete len:485 (+) Transcript_25376:84-1538(+)
MASPPSAKRRRLDDGCKVVRHVERHEYALRSSLQELYKSMETYADVIVVVQGASSSRDFPCVSALLASASRPIAAMLYGPMRATTSSNSTELPRLHLSMTEPWCFEQLLQYIHGIHIALNIDSAAQLHHVADFYEVLQLRDECCKFLLDAVEKDNCCDLLRRSQEVHCDQLWYRCTDFLTYEFMSVVDCDPDFPSLDHSVLLEVLSRDELVCHQELQVLQALVQWYSRQPSAAKLAQMQELLSLVRWSLLSDEENPAVEQLISKLVVHNESGVDSPRAAGRLKKAASESSPMATEIQSLARELYAKANEPQSSPAVERQLRWGVLLVSNPCGRDETPGSQEEATKYVLECTKQYMVGRSRRSNIRIGHDAPMPYISSQHFKVYHTVHWPSAEGKSPAVNEQPYLEGQLEDLSQNGTFVNGKLVGKGGIVPLEDGDKIELVFPQGRVPVASNAKSFPFFTYRTLTAHAPALDPGLSTTDMGSDRK